MSCLITAHVAERDERESGLCAIMNALHSFALALETAMGYRNWRYREARMTAACERDKRMRILPG